MGYGEGRSSDTAQCGSETLNDPFRFEKGGAVAAHLAEPPVDPTNAACAGIAVLAGLPYTDVIQTPDLG